MSDGRMRRWGDGPEEEDDEDEGEEGEEEMERVNPEEWKGKTIRSAVRIQAEGGRTYGKYLCIIFDDGGKTILALSGSGRPCDPDPSVDEMRKAPDFYSPEDIADAVLQIERRKRAKRAERIRSKRQQIERLQHELDQMEK